MALDDIPQRYIPRNNQFYREHYHQVIYVLMLLIVIMVAAVIVLMYEVFYRPLPQFNAMQADEKRMLLTAYDRPNQESDTILRWASKAATIAYTFDFVNYSQQINAVRPYFTNEGWQDYLRSVSGLISTIKQKQLFVNGIVSGAPVIANQGDLPGKGYVWRIQIPFLVTYQSANTTSRQNYYVVITIIRVPTHINPQGIGIDQFVMR